MKDFINNVFGSATNLAVVVNKGKGTVGFPISEQVRVQ